MLLSLCLALLLGTAAAQGQAPAPMSGMNLESVLTRMDTAAAGFKIRLKISNPPIERSDAVMVAPDRNSMP